jgi:hypothetical protein
MINYLINCKTWCSSTIPTRSITHTFLTCNSKNRWERIFRAMIFLRSSCVYTDGVLFFSLHRQWSLIYFLFYWWWWDDIIDDVKKWSRMRRRSFLCFSQFRAVRPFALWIYWCSFFKTSLSLMLLFRAHNSNGLVKNSFSNNNTNNKQPAITITPAATWHKH